MDERQRARTTGKRKSSSPQPARLQPGIIIDNRTEIEQDLWTPEQYQPTEWVRHAKTGELVTWEACQTFSGSWGYHRDETTWKIARNAHPACSSTPSPSAATC